MATIEANNLQLEYETFGDRSSPSLLLMIGLGSQLIHWQDEFCQGIADHGYHVIRYDNRDAGLSTKLSGPGLSEITEAIMALFSGEKVPVPYTIEDMAEDALGLLDGLHIDKAHICGMSMGGYIAQRFAINNPSRTLSLTSIYSHCGNRKEFLPTQEIMDAMLAPAPKEREPFIEYMVNFFKLIYGSGLPFDEKFHTALAARSYDRSFCPEGTGRQYLAIMVQKDRRAALGELKVPSLIIHGDEDPLVPLAGGKATAAAIPGSELVVIKGMGHALPNLSAYGSAILSAMTDHMGKVAA